MNYTFKLSRRLASFRAAGVLAASLFTLSCAAEGPNEPGSSPDPTRVSISPETVTLGINQTTQFEASMDSSAPALLSSSKGNKGRGRNAVVDLTVAPNTYTMAEGSAASFTAVGTLRDGSVLAPSVTWTATGGTIDASGKYTAGPISGNYSVSAKASNGVADTAIVIVTETTPTVTNISLSPTSTSLPAGGSKQFTAVGTASDGATIPVSPKYAATGGTVSSTGMYKAGQTPGAYRIIATDTVSSLADTSAVTITAVGATLQSVVLIPATASVAQGAKQQFSASGKMSDGSTVPISPSFAATGGSISSSGEYTAGSTVGTYRVIAADTVSGNADTSSVTITASPATLQAVVLTPATASLAAGAKQQFSASGTMSDGSTVPISPSFAATGGSISSSGEYTAGSTAGTYRVIATDTVSGNADTSSVTVTALPVTLQAVVLTPMTVSLAAGAAQQFTASGKLSDGSTTSVSVTWSASGGTISSAGLYTAGQTAGTFRVIASESGGTLADTSVVSVAAPPLPPPSSSEGCPTTGYTRLVNVSTAAQLTSAITNALPGDQIRLAPGTYAGSFTANKDGTQAAPITLCGPRTAVKSATSGAFTITGDWWVLRGFRINGGLYGINAVNANHNVIDSLLIENLNQEGIVLQGVSGSSYNIIKNTTIRNTGRNLSVYGEAIYIGSGKTNADPSNNNQILNNIIGPNVTAEHIDMKVGTSGNLVKGNVSDATGTLFVLNQVGGVYTIAGANQRVEDNSVVNLNQAQMSAFWPFLVNGAVLHGNVALSSANPSMSWGFRVSNSTNVQLYCDNTGTKNVACTP